MYTNYLEVYAKNNPYRGEMHGSESFLGRKIFHTEVKAARESIYGQIIDVLAAFIMPFYFLAYNYYTKSIAIIFYP